MFTVAALGIALEHRCFHNGAVRIVVDPGTLIIMLLSGSSTSLESMRMWLKDLVPVMWLETVETAAIGNVFFYRSRRVIFSG